MGVQIAVVIQILIWAVLGSGFMVGVWIRFTSACLESRIGLYVGLVRVMNGYWAWLELRHRPNDEEI